MSDVKLGLPDEPEFRSVSGLENLTFDGENIVSGRGATEDQLKVLWDKYLAVKAEVEALENNPQDAIVQEINERMDTLETLIEQGCESFSPSESQVFQTLQDRVDALELQVEECCDRGVMASGGAAPVDGGAEVTVDITWAANPLENGGLATAQSSGGGEIVSYWFLAQKANGIFLKMKVVVYAGKLLSLDPETGQITVTESDAVPATAKLFLGATDDAGSEGIATILANAAPWYTPPSGG